MMTRSIKTRVVWQVSTLIALAMLAVTITVSLITYSHMNTQMQRLLHSKAQATQLRLEQRLDVLVESSLLLAKNEFVLNAFVDGSTKNLPVLVRNFIQGKDVLSVSIVDFDGRPLYKSVDTLPSYHDSAQLRSALAMGRVALAISSDNHLRLMVPISYYDTIQGAIIVMFDLRAIAQNIIPKEDWMRLSIRTQERTLHDFNPFNEVEFSSYAMHPTQSTPLLERLGIIVDIGLPREETMRPVVEVIERLALLGLFFIVVGIGLSIVLGRSITHPIVTLFDRVKHWNSSQNIVCSPIGTDDELEELARAFDEQSLQLKHQAEHDMLTGLPNRFLFDTFIQLAIQKAREESTQFALFFIDLDNFKEVNDSFGHAIGDALLQEVGRHLGATLKAQEQIARMGGDEFAIIVQNNLSIDALEERIEEIMRFFRRIQTIESYQFLVTCSIGIAIYPQSGTDAQSLLKNADAAMYQSKEEGKNSYHFYTMDMTQKAYERVMLEAKLHTAIKLAQFVVYYQPQVDMRTQEIVGLEALVRWRMEDGTMVSPAQFIPLAEKSGMIVAIDDFVMRQGMIDFAGLYARGFRGTLSLNLSILQLNQKNFMEKLSAFIDESGMPLGHLKLEVTETQVMKNPEMSIAILRKIRDRGIGLAIDDFGTGHSSLFYLKQLPIEKIKIDQSFVRDLPDDSDDAQLSKTIIAMGRNMHLDIIAEGVQTPAQAAFLIENGCYEAQGFLYYRPMPLEDVALTLFGA